MCHSCELDCDIAIEFLGKPCCTQCFNCAKYFDSIAHGDVLLSLGQPSRIDEP